MAFTTGCNRAARTVVSDLLQSKPLAARIPQNGDPQTQLAGAETSGTLFAELPAELTGGVERVPREIVQAEVGESFARFEMELGAAAVVSERLRLRERRFERAPRLDECPRASVGPCRGDPGGDPLRVKTVSLRELSGAHERVLCGVELTQQDELTPGVEQSMVERLGG